MEKGTLHASVLQWSKYHDLVPSDRAQKIPKNVRGLILQGQLFDRASDLVKAIPPHILMSDDGVFAFANAIHKFDALSATTDAFQSFLTALLCVRGTTETFTNFESRFEATLCKVRNAYGTVVVMPDVFWDLMLLSNARVDPSHKVSILARIAGKKTPQSTAMHSTGETSATDITQAAPNVQATGNTSHVSSTSAASSFHRSSTELVANAIDDALSAITYEDVAIIISACDMSITERAQYTYLSEAARSTPNPRQIPKKIFRVHEDPDLFFRALEGRPVLS